MRYVLLSALVVALLWSPPTCHAAAEGTRAVVEYMRYERKLALWQARQQQIIERQQARTDRLLRIKFGIYKPAAGAARQANPLWNGDPAEVPEDAMRVPPDQMREMAERFRKENPGMRLKAAPR
jgi:hypothetical protein